MENKPINTQDDTPSGRKYVFVCGLHRSGTSVLGRNIARLEDCTGFKNTGATEDEGQFLQDIYPIAAKYGGPGRFGFDPRAHRIETSNLLTPENVHKLRRSWHAYWDNSKSICVEKTPPNLLMTRFLQAAFPESYFVVIRRHPVPVSMATRKLWKINMMSFHYLFEHWLHCHEIFDKDKKHLNYVYELRYEDYVADPSKYHHEIATFIGTRVPEPPKEDKFRTLAKWRNLAAVQVPERAMEQIDTHYNQKYFDRWCKLLKSSIFKKYYRYIANKYEARFADYGYSLIDGLGVNKEIIERDKALFPALYCFAADANASLWRSSARAKSAIKRQMCQH